MGSDSQGMLESMSKKELIALIEDMTKRWLAHDGVWFQCVESKHGLEEAVDLDGRAWDRFSRIEAGRIMRFHNIPPGGGIPALTKALGLRQYSLICKQEVIDVNKNKIIFRMNTCRVQMTRKRKGMPDFPCSSVGILEFSGFAETIDPRIKTRCLTCPPDHPDEYFCAWEFSID